MYNTWRQSGAARPKPRSDHLLGGAVLVLALLSACVGSGSKPEDVDDSLQRFETPPQKRAPHFVEPLVAVAGDVELHVLGVLFSGTETLVEIEQRGRLGVIDLPEQEVTVPGSFEGFRAYVADGRLGGHRVVRLPAVAPPEDYAGFFLLIIEAGDLRWTFELPGPDRDSLDERLRTEELQPLSISVEGRQIALTGQRSTSETLVEIRGMSPLVLPYLRAEDGELVPPYFWQPLVGGAELSFPPTPFGTRVALGLDAFGEVGLEERLHVTVNVTQVLSRAGAGSETHGTFAVAAADVVSGDPEAVLALTRGADHRGEWIGLRIRGSWHDDSPELRDDDGNLLQGGSGMIEYSRDAAGNLTTGQTEIRGYPRSRTVHELSLSIQGASVVVTAPDAVILEPADDE